VISTTMSPCNKRLIELWGPMIGYWCWAMERQNQSLKAIVDDSNKKEVENFVMKEIHIQRDLQQFVEPTLSTPATLKQ